ncbi:hypothetical protein L916_15512 [Phytophthora nicotianae]|uniref:Uncharacterized protein n=1 Tax=Phytophthora nicotianae TaxID=4792 RepID=W2IE32_PHYNI|nr:hypothetical protein L916_15512 [Phytophthora nicotianae]
MGYSLQIVSEMESSATMNRDSKILMKLALRTLLGHYGCPVTDGKLVKILPDHVDEVDQRDLRLELKLHLGGLSDEPLSRRGVTGVRLRK